MKDFFNKYYKIWMPILSVSLFISFMEFICRNLGLTDLSDVGFKFYVRHVDNDIRLPYMIEDSLLMWIPKVLYLFFMSRWLV